MDASGTEMPNPSKALNWFIIVTTIYSILVFNKTKTKPGPGPGDNNDTTIYTIIYLVLTLVIQFFISLSIAEAYCGSNQWGTAGIVTFVPWIIIFGSLISLLRIFPGWLRPFSNTIGYGIARIGGLNQLFLNQLKPQGENKGKTLANVYLNKSLLINEITTENINQFITNMSTGEEAIFRNDERKEFEEKLYSLVVLKNVVAEYVWYVLAGLLITTMSYNSIINTNCNKNINNMQERREAYLKKLDSNN